VPAPTGVMGTALQTTADKKKTNSESEGEDSLPPETGSRVWLYDVDGEDAPIRLDGGDIQPPTDDQMLWIDVDWGSTEQLQGLWDQIGIRDQIGSFDTTRERPQVVHHNGLLQLNVFALRDDSELDPIALLCLVGTNWIVTVHDGELDLVDKFNKPFHGETNLGALDGPTFLSLVLDWQVTGYFKAIETLQADIDRLDEELLQHSPDQDALLDRLLGLRRRVRRLRQTLAPHRDVLGLLSHPESDAAVGSAAAPNYQRTSERLERALDSVDTAREMIVGSFDIFMSRTAQATNDLIKRLTIVSVLLLPAVVIAGIMGMNFKVAIFDWPWMFWVTLGLMALLAAATLIVARRRNWI
jgi:magnesium transporter